MRYVFWIFLMAWAWLRAAPTTPEQMEAAFKARPETDEIHWKDATRGAPLKVRILEITENSVIVEKQLPSGLTRRTIPLNELTDVKFSLTPWEISLHRETGTESLAALRILWQRRSAAFRFPSSGIFRTAIALAKTLRWSATDDGFDEAEKILRVALEEVADNSQRTLLQGELHCVLLSRAIRKESHEEANRLAWEITEEASEASPDAMLLATGFLADRHFSQLRAIEAEHPRWMEDDEIKPIRERLYHLSLDFALYPSLFHGQREPEASTGLKNAALVYQFAGETDLWKGALEDLIQLYPDSPAAKEMAPVLEKFHKSKNSAAPPDVPVEPTEDLPEAEPVPSQNPPPPKNYNLFSD
jgi:hypothetical protein